MQFLHTPIPDQATLRALRGVRQYPLDFGSMENNEPAVDILASGILGENYYHRSDNPPYWHSAPGSISELYVRTGVLRRLHAVNEVLKKMGYELYVFDAYRPVEVQSYFHDVWVPNYLHEKNPDWSRGEVAEVVGMYWSAGYPDLASINPTAPPPHVTGGVVDCTLVHEGTTDLLFMGSDFDEVSTLSFVDYFEREETVRTLTDTQLHARNNRRVLYHAMTSSGFVVNPNEWWHFGYGDQLSAQLSGAPHSVYSVLRLNAG